MSKKIYTHDTTFFDCIDSESKAYWLGFMHADGTVSRNAIAIVLKQNDREHLQKFADAIRCKVPIRDYYYKPKNPESSNTGAFSRFYLRSSELVDGLLKNGITKNKTATVKPWVGPIDLMPHFWRGLFDGDGGIWLEIEKSGKRDWRAALSGNHDTMIAFANLTEKELNIPIGKRVRLNGKSKIGWQCRYVGNQHVRRVMSYLYDSSTIHLDRKNQLYHQIIQEVPDGFRWGKLTPEIVNGLYFQFGTWKAVADHLGCDPGYFYHVRKNIGM